MKTGNIVTLQIEFYDLYLEIQDTLKSNLLIVPVKETCGGMVEKRACLVAFSIAVVRKTGWDQGIMTG